MSLFRRKKKESEKQPEIEITNEIMWELNDRRRELERVPRFQIMCMDPAERAHYEEEYGTIVQSLYYVSSELYEYPRKYEDSRLKDKDAAIDSIQDSIAAQRAKEEAERAAEEARAREESKIQFSLAEEKDPDIRYSISTGPSTPSAFYVWKELHQRLFKSFPIMLLRLIDEQHIDHITFYKRAGIDTKLFSKIVNTPDYKPSKNTAIQCCLGLQLNDEEAKMLLETAGYSLSPSSDFDLVIQYCIENRIYNTMDVDELLYAVTQKTLTSRY